MGVPSRRSNRLKTPISRQLQVEISLSTHQTMTQRKALHAGKEYQDMDELSKHHRVAQIMAYTSFNRKQGGLLKPFKHASRRKKAMTLGRRKGQNSGSATEDQTQALLFCTRVL